jgi:hypothetical protein
VIKPVPIRANQREIRENPHVIRANPREIRENPRYDGGKGSSASQPTLHACSPRQPMEANALRIKG